MWGQSILNGPRSATTLDEISRGADMNPWNWNRSIARFSQSGRGPGAAAADWAYKQGWRRVAVITADYAGGLEVMGAFTRVFCLRGGQVIQEQYPPLGTADFGPYINNLNRNVD